MAHSSSSITASLPLSRRSSDNMAATTATTREFVASPVTRNRFILRATTVSSSTGEPVASRHGTTTTIVTSGGGAGEERFKSRPTTTSAAYFAPDESSCTFVDLSSTINTVLPTLRRSMPLVTTQSRHFSLSDGGDSSSDGGQLPTAQQQPSTPIRIDPPPPPNEFMHRVSSHSLRSLTPASPTTHTAIVPTSRSVGNVIAVAAAQLSTVVSTSTIATSSSPDASSANAATTTTSPLFHFGYHVPLETGHIQVNLRKHESDRSHQVMITNSRQRVDGTNWSRVARRHPATVPLQRVAGTNGGASSSDGGSSAVFVLPKPSSASSSTSTHRSTSPLLLSPTQNGPVSGSAAFDHFDGEQSMTEPWRQRSNSAASETRSAYSSCNDRLVRNASDDENTHVTPRRHSSTKSGWKTSEWTENDDKMESSEPHSRSLSSKPIVEESSAAVPIDMQHRSSQYLGELVWQVDEMVFCGGIEAAQNQNLLCRLNIEYIVDLSSQDDDPDLINRPRSECPCLCPKRTAHSRVIMAIRIRDDSDDVTRSSVASSTDAGNATGSSGSALLAVGGGSTVGGSKEQFREREEIIRCFEMLIDLIRKARIRQKKVLIQSLKGRNRAPAFVAAYLMHCNRCTRVEALTKISKMVSKTRPGMCISDRLQRALMRWQSVLGIRSDDAAARLDANSITKIFAVKKSAWS